MKAILVIDKPIDCQSCLCNDYEEGYCKAFGDGRTNVCDWNSGSIPQWCPLKPMPNKKEIHNENGYYDLSQLFHEGWNYCIDAITGETE